MIREMVNKFACRVCGNIQLDPPWGDDGQSPNYDICDCCGAEFGYSDCTFQAIQSFRKQWLDSGAKWKDLQKKPANWHFEEQLKNIPEKFI